jgi:hypothetical protein
MKTAPRNPLRPVQGERIDLISVSVVIHRQMREEVADLDRPHLGRVALVVKQNEAPRPIDRRLLGMQAVRRRRMSARKRSSSLGESCETTLNSIRRILGSPKIRLKDKNQANLIHRAKTLI